MNQVWYVNICVRQSSLCNQSGAKSELVLCLYMKITACLPALLNLSRENVCELVSTFSAYESCLVYLKKTCGSYVNVSWWKCSISHPLQSPPKEFSMKVTTYMYMHKWMSTLPLNTPENRVAHSPSNMFSDIWS